MTQANIKFGLSLEGIALTRTEIKALTAARRERHVKAISTCEANIRDLSLPERRFIHSCNWTMSKRAPLTDKQAQTLLTLASRVGHIA